MPANHTIAGSLVRAGFLAALLLPALPAQQPDVDFHRSAVFGRLTWQELGPVIFGGRIVDLAVHPTQPQIFWVASASGGLWKTENGGISFEPQFQDAHSISIGDIALAPSRPEVLYVGTGEANNQRSSYWGDGVYKSSDSGKTFHHVGLQGTDHIGRIAVHPSNPDVVFVAALGALYSANPERGLYRTLDGGAHWECVKHLGPDVGFVDVVFDPKDPDTIYASSYQRRRRAWHFSEGGEGSRVWRSSDGGITWIELGGGLPKGNLGRIGLDVCASNPQVVYACIENNNPAPAGRPEPDRTEDDSKEPKDGEAGPEATAEELADPLARFEAAQRAAAAQDPRESRRRTVGGEVWRSDDGGDTWRKTNSASQSVGGSPGYYYGQIRVDPGDADTVYVLSVPVHVSRDGGKTWTPSGGRRGGSSFASGIHVDHHALWIDPRDGRHAILGNDGGLHVTRDGGQHWDHLNHLPIAQFYAIGVDTRDPYRVYGGLQDNGTWGFAIRGDTSSGIGRLDSVRINGGDGFYVCCDPDDPDIVYSESQFGMVSRANLRTGERKSIRPRAERGSPPLRSNWMSPILLSPHSGSTVYFGTQYLHRSRNRGDSWQTISPDLTTNDPDKIKGNVPHCTITTIAESPRREGMLWVGTDDGRVWLSRTGGERWTDLGDRFPAEVRHLWVSRVEASPHQADTAWVAFTGYREDIRKPFLFVTTDGGETFRSIANDLPQEPINVVRAHPRNEGVLLVGTEFGAYVSMDHGGGWFRLGGNLPRVAVHDLVVHPRESHVLVGTHGRGIWAMDAAALEQVAPEILAKDFHVFPPSDGVMLRRSFGRGNRGAREWSVQNPFTEATFRFYLREDADQDVKVEVLDATGSVLWTGGATKDAGLHEVAWTAPRRGGPGGAGGGFGRGGGGGNTGPRPGHFAVRVTHGEQSSTLPFRVRDLRGPRSPLGSPVTGDEAEMETEAGLEAAAGGRR